MGASSLAGAAGFVAGREVGESNGASDTSDTERFALHPDYVNLTTFLLAPHPRIVREAIERYRRALDANPALYLSQSEKARGRCTRSGGRLSGNGAGAGRPDRLHDDGAGLVYARLRLEPGDEVVTTEHEFYATHEALRLRQALDGVTVRRIRLYNEPESASLDAIVAAVAAALGPRTRCLALTWVHSSSGVKLPLREIAATVALANRNRRERAHPPLRRRRPRFRRRGWFAGRARRGRLRRRLPQVALRPRGTGLVWAAPHAWERLAPTIPSFDERAYLAWIEGHAPDDTPPPGPLMTPGGFHSFEHRWALTEAFRFHDELGGREKVAATTRALAARLKEGLAEIRGVTVKTPRDDALSSGLVCVDVLGTPAPEAVARLRDEHRVVASATPYATRYLRFGPSVANTEDDVDRTLAAVASVAA